MRTTKIEWTDRTWDPVTGCTKISAGCAHCYAETMAHRLCAMGVDKYANAFIPTLHEDILGEPLKWKHSHTIFVCSMADLFHEASNKVISEVFETYNYYWNEDKDVTTDIITDRIMDEFYLLAGEFGKRKGLSEENNPYFNKAEDEAGNWFGFSYALGWILSHKPKSTSRYKNKLVLLYDSSYDCNIIGVAIGVAKMYRFFSRSCDELRSVLSETEAIAA